MNSGNRLVVYDSAGLDVAQCCSIGAFRWASLFDAGIWVASLGWNTVGNQVLPSITWVTAVAARLVWCAIEEVLCGTGDQWADLASDAESVFEGFDGGEGPASAALSLVSDGTDA